MEKKTEKEKKYMKELQDRYIRFDWAIKRLVWTITQVMRLASDNPILHVG